MNPSDPVARRVTELVDRVQRVHHEPLADELPRLRALAVEVYRLHREHHPELDDVIDCFDDLHDDLAPHLAREDAVLFPLLRDLDRLDGDELRAAAVPGPVRVLMREHAESKRQLARLRAATRNYAVPEDAPPSYRALLEGLRGLDAGLRAHLHDENEVLFPAALALVAADGGTR